VFLARTMLSGIEGAGWKVYNISWVGYTIGALNLVEDFDEYSG
jgi:hypothetical protein